MRMLAQQILHPAPYRSWLSVLDRDAPKNERRDYTYPYRPNRSMAVQDLCHSYGEVSFIPGRNGKI